MKIANWLILGHIEGLIEAWYTDNDGIRLDLTMEQPASRVARLLQLFRLLDNEWIIEQMDNEHYTSEKKTLKLLATMASTGQFKERKG